MDIQELTVINFWTLEPTSGSISPNTAFIAGFISNFLLLDAFHLPPPSPLRQSEEVSVHTWSRKFPLHRREFNKRHPRFECCTPLRIIEGRLPGRERRMWVLMRLSFNAALAAPQSPGIEGSLRYKDVYNREEGRERWEEGASFPL